MHCLGYSALGGYMCRTRQAAIIRYTSINTFSLLTSCLLSHSLCRMLLMLTTEDLKFDFYSFFSISPNNDCIFLFHTSSRILSDEVFKRL